MGWICGSFFSLLCGCSGAEKPSAPADSATTGSRESGADSRESGADSRESSADSRDSGADDSGMAEWDGQPCAAYGPEIALGQVTEPSLNEISGIAVSRRNPGVVWVHEDSGAEPLIHGLNRDGTVAGVIRLEGVENTDWEDIAVGVCDPLEPERSCVVVGDIGTLGTARADFLLLRFEEPLLDGTGGEQVIAPEVYPVVYPEAAEDAESLALTPEGLPVVVTKREDATAGVFRLPDWSAGVWEAAGEVPTGAAGEDLTARATAADLWPDGSRLILRTYFHIWEFYPADDLSALPLPVELDGAFELQGEAIAWDTAEGGFLQISEGVTPTLYRVPCG